VSSADVARVEGALFTTSLVAPPQGLGLPETISAKSAIHFRQAVG